MTEGESSDRVRNAFGEHSGLILVADDDPLVGARIAECLHAQGCRAVHVADLELVYQLCVAAEPALLIVDHIEDDPAINHLLRRLDLTPVERQVLLLRYAPGPVEVFRNLRVRVLAGEAWFEQLPSAAQEGLAALGQAGGS